MSGRVIEVMAWRPEVPGWDPDDRPPSWQDAALCAQTDPEVWFPEIGFSPAPAKRICALCPVKAECLEFALENSIGYGVWGGLTENQRRPLHAARERETGPRLCVKRLHPLAGANLLSDGRCRECRVASRLHLAKGAA